MSELFNASQAKVEIQIGDLSNDFLSQFVYSIQIIENIFSSYIEANIVLIDGASLKERINFKGDEKVVIKFNSVLNQPTTYNLNIARIEQTVITNTARSKSFTIKAVSSELIWDSMINVSRSYKGSTKDMIQDLLKNFLKSNKKIEVENTKDLECIIIPYLSPFQAIDMIRKRSVSEDSPKNNYSSAFLFFENQDGFTFKSMEYLFKEAQNKNTLTYTQKMDLVSDIKNSFGAVSDLNQAFTFYGYNISRDFDLPEQLSRGALQTTIIQYDITKKKFSSRKFQFNKETFPLMNKENSENIISDSVIQKFNNTENKAFYIPYMSYRETSNLKPNHLFDIFPEKMCYASIISQFRTLVSIPGNNKLKAGDLINLEVPTYDEDGIKNTVTSGKYLVATINHNIVVGIEPKYTCDLELYRNDKGKRKET